MTEKEFFIKYPDADPNRFVFKDGKVWFKINPDNEHRLVNIKYRSFYDSPGWAKYLTSYKDNGFGIWSADGTVQTYDINHETTTNMDINKIKIYVTDDKWFLSDLSPYTVTNTLLTDYKKNPFLASLLAAYVTTYVCGISVKHFEYNDHTPSIITSMARYHLYYHMSRFLRDPSKLERYMSHIIPFVRKHTPYVKVWEDMFYETDMTLTEWYKWAENRDPEVRNYSYDKKRGGIKYQALIGARNGHANDYRRFIAHETSGLTKIGQKLFQRSVQSYVYAVLGAQAKTRWSIVDEGAKSLQTQDVFYTISKETISESDVTIMISNMRTAIESTNVVLNMAISPGMILVPSNLIIQKKKIPGYNNVLTLATDKMKFGKNAGINYIASASQSSASQSSASQGLAQGGNAPKTTSSVSKGSTQGGNTGLKLSETKPKSPKISVASEILGVTMMIGGFLISKYVF